ncbi:MAG: hypothetical protein ACWGMY_04835 [Hyphomicrobiaceae bacterium]
MLRAVPAAISDLLAPLPRNLLFSRIATKAIPRQISTAIERWISGKRALAVNNITTKLIVNANPHNSMEGIAPNLQILAEVDTIARKRVYALLAQRLGAILA